MKNLSLVVLACAVLAAPVSAADLVRSPEDASTFNTCKAMPTAERNASTACKAIMQKTKVSSSDMDKMKHCESPQADINKDPVCKQMLDKHPEVARGHGRLEPDAETNTPVPGTNGAPAPKSN
jgi:hypothetical protein